MKNFDIFYRPGGVRPLPANKCTQYKDAFLQAEAAYMRAADNNELIHTNLRLYLDVFYEALTTKSLINRKALHQTVMDFKRAFDNRVAAKQLGSINAAAGVSRLGDIATEIETLYNLKQFERPVSEKTGNVVEFGHP